MHVRLDRPDRIEELIEFLGQRGCRARVIAPNELEVFLVSSIRHDLVYLQLDLYLRLWSAVHPDAEAVLLAGD